MATVVLHRGTVEVETLTRYGRVPAGTRAKGSVVVSDTGTPFMQFCRVFEITVGNDPRPFGWTVHFDWNGTEGKPHHWGRVFRGKGVSFVTNSFLEYLTQTLTRDIEGHSTSTGRQQFRFVGVEWTKAKAKPKGAKAAKPKKPTKKRK